MITSTFLLLMIFFLEIIHLLLSFLNFVIPDAVTDAIAEAISYSAYFVGVLPVQNIMTAMLTLLSFLVLWYGAKLAMKLFHMLPWVGKKIDIK